MRKISTISTVLASAGLMVLGMTSIATPSYATSPTQLCEYHNNTDLTAVVSHASKTADVTNNTSNCAFKVGVATYSVYSTQGFAAYKAFFSTGKDTGDNIADATKYNLDMTWLYTQTLFDSKTEVINPGQTIHFTYNLPSCGYQLDVFAGDVVTKFGPTSEDYDRSGASKFIGSNEEGFVPSPVLCVAPTPTPTVTPTPTPTVTPTPTPTPTSTPQVLGVSATPTPTPLKQLPSTGPGDVFLIALFGVVASLIAKKYTFAN